MVCFLFLVTGVHFLAVCPVVDGDAEVHALAQPLMGQFAEAVASKVESGEIDQACVLVNNATETAWFQRMLTVAAAVCFPAGRVRFLDPQGKPGAPLQGQAVLYFGKNGKEFIKSFQPFGIVCKIC